MTTTYTLSAVIDGQTLYLNHARNAFIVKRAADAGTYRTHETADAEAKRSRKFMQNDSVMVHEVDSEAR